MSRIKMIGDRYGKLVVIREINKVGKERRFLCQCDCGNRATVRSTNLLSGHTKSCGCLLGEINIDKDYIINKMFSFYKSEKRRATAEELTSLIGCSYKTISRKLEGTTVTEVWEEIEEGDKKMDINDYMTPNEAAHRFGIKTERLKEKLRPSRNAEEIEQMVDEGLIKYFIEPGKKNRSWIISIDAMRRWFPNEIKKD